MSEIYYTNIVATEVVIDIWNYARKHLIPSIDKSGGRWNAEHVLAGLVSGRQSLWIVTDDDPYITKTGSEFSRSLVGAMTTGITHYPCKTVLSVHFLGGKGFENWCASAMEAIESYAKKHECEAIECNGRKGLAKTLPGEWSQPSIFYEKEI